MQTIHLKLTIVALIGCLVVAGVYISTTDDKQKHNQQVAQFLSQVDKAPAPAVTKMPSVTMPANHPKLSHSSHSNVSAGKKEDFLEVANLKHWQVIETDEGIASLKYRLQLDGQRLEMAVIRMNKEVSLDTVVNIWKQKAGLTAQHKIDYQPFNNQSGQQFYLTEMKGPLKTIWLAIHKQQKYTFFRLSGNSADQAMAAFKDFLHNTRITG